jgi:hypothetical protein
MLAPSARKLKLVQPKIMRQIFARIESRFTGRHGKLECEDIIRLE